MRCDFTILDDQVPHTPFIKTTQDELWFIDTDDELDALCQRIEKTRHLGIDTEFERRRTYYAELCLVQVTIDDTFACVDPYAVSRVDVLIAALNRSPEPKVMHAARQDLEVLVQAGGAVPAPLYDTQLAAGLIGYPEQIGYADLVFELLGVSLAKSQTRSDWRTRPLNPEQLNYAVDDVRYLRPIKEALDRRLVELGRDAWLMEDCAALADKDNYEFAVEDAWQRTKGIGNLSPEAFARAVALAAWRETTARRRNLPRSWVLKDNQLVKLATCVPTTKRTLDEQCALSAAAIRRYGDELISINNYTQGTDAVAKPNQRPLTEAGRRACKLLNTKVRDIASALDIAPPLLMTRKEMGQVVGGQMPERIVEGWRQEIVGPAVRATIDTLAQP